MKVLHVYRTYFPDTQGGVQEVVRQVSLATSNLGVTNRIFTPSPNPVPQIIEHPEGEIHRVKLNFEVASCGFCFTGIPEFKRQVAWADIVHYHFPWPFADIMHFVAKVSKPTIVTYHSDIVRQRIILPLYTPLMNRFLRKVNRVVCTSPNYLASSVTLSNLRKPCGIIPIGLDRNSYPKPNRDDLNRVEDQYGNNFFLFVGLLRYYKGLHTLIEAAQFTDQKIIIVGSGPIEEELEKQAKELGVKNIIFTGYVSDLEKMALIQLSRALVFPSHLRSEAFGVTLLEGAMNAKPLITAEVGTGTSYVNSHGETGIVVSPENADALAEAINELADDSDLVRKLGAGSLTRFESLFTSTQMANAYLHEYEHLLATKS